jgi:hypothetical protein
MLFIAIALLLLFALLLLVMEWRMEEEGAWSSLAGAPERAARVKGKGGGEIEGYSKRSQG